MADSLISNLGGKVDEGIQAAWEDEIGKRVAELDSANSKTTSWRKCACDTGRNCPVLSNAVEFHGEAAAEYDAAFDWYFDHSPDGARKFDAEGDRAYADPSRPTALWRRPVPDTQVLAQTISFYTTASGSPRIFRWQMLATPGASLATGSSGSSRTVPCLA